MNGQLISTALLAIVQLAALVRAYYGLKADNAKLRADLALGLLNERAERTGAQTTLKDQVMTAVAIVDDAVKDLTRRVSTLEAGQDEWTKMLRERTHELADKVDVLMLKVDRLERPTQ